MSDEPNIRVYEILVTPEQWSEVYRALEKQKIRLRDLSPGLVNTAEHKDGVRTFICEHVRG